jgi:lipopolysaccharide transport system ATP-binding protein
VEKFIDTPVKRYSSGMYVRLAFAVAAHLDPEILIVDEVLAVGDAQFQKKCLGKMGEVARSGRTVLYVSHNMASIKRLCTSATWLDKGRIFDIGFPFSVIGKYLRENFVADATVVIVDHQHAIKSCLQIKSVEVMNSALQPSAMMFFKEDIYIKLGVQAAEDVSQARVGIGICTDGVRLSTVHTPPLDFSKSVDQQYILCKIKGNSLLPNHYSLQLGAYSAENGHALHWVVDAASFSIAAISDGAKGEFDEKDMGLVRIDVEWDVVPLPK